MKKIIFLAILVLTGLTVNAQKENPNYNKALADSLGADEYGMKSYIFVILKTGPNTINDKEKVNSLFRGHLDNINRLAKLNKLIVAGPFEKNDNAYRGLFIFNVKTTEEAKELLQTDPAIEAGLLEAMIYKWYGSAALPEYLKVSEKITKKNP